MVGSASASASLNVDIQGSEYSGDQGLVNYVAVDVDKTMTWDGFDEPLRYIRFKHEITLDNAKVESDTSWHTLYDKRSGRLTEWSGWEESDGWGGPGEYVTSHSGDKEDYLKGEAHADVSWAVISDGGHPSEYDSVQTPVDWTDLLSVGKDGATKYRMVRWRTTLKFYTEDDNGDPVQITDDDGVAEVTGEDYFQVKVTNEGGEIGGESTGGSKTA